MGPRPFTPLKGPFSALLSLIATVSDLGLRQVTSFTPLSPVSGLPPLSSPALPSLLPPCPSVSLSPVSPISLSAPSISTCYTPHFLRPLFQVKILPEKISHHYPSALPPTPTPPPPTPRSSSTTVRRRITPSAQFPSPTPRKPCSAPAISLMCASWVCLCVDVALGQSCGIRSCCSATPFTTELEHTWVQRIELSLVDLRISLRLHTTLPRTRTLLGLLYFPRGHVVAPTQLPVINARRSSSGLNCMC